MYKMNFLVQSSGWSGSARYPGFQQGRLSNSPRSKNVHGFGMRTFSKHTCRLRPSQRQVQFDLRRQHRVFGRLSSEHQERGILGYCSFTGISAKSAGDPRTLYGQSQRQFLLFRGTFRLHERHQRKITGKKSVRIWRVYVGYPGVPCFLWVPKFWVRAAYAISTVLQIG